MSYYDMAFSCPRRIFGIHCDGFIMMAAMLLFIPTKAFAASLGIPSIDIETGSVVNQTKRLQWKQIDKEFTLLKHLSDLINKAFGSVVILFLLETLLSFSAGIDGLVKLIKNAEWRLVIADTVYFSHCICVILLSADTYSQVSQVCTTMIYYNYCKIIFRTMVLCLITGLQIEGLVID